MKAKAHWLHYTVQSHSQKLCPVKANEWQVQHAPVDDKAGLRASWVHFRAGVSHRQQDQAAGA